MWFEMKCACTKVCVIIAKFNFYSVMIIIYHNITVIPPNQYTSQPYDRYVVGVQKADKIIGHAPKKISIIFCYFMQHNRTINAEILGTGNLR